MTVHFRQIKKSNFTKNESSTKTEKTIKNYREYDPIYYYQWIETDLGDLDSKFPKNSRYKAFFFWYFYLLFITLVYKFFLKNALYWVFNWFPLILGRWFRMRSPFFTIRSEFCSVASFVFSGSKIKLSKFSKIWLIFFWKLVTYS